MSVVPKQRTHHMLSDGGPRCYLAPSPSPSEHAVLRYISPALTGALFVLGMSAGITACTPTVRVATDQPITINLNVNIKHEIRIKVDKELDGVLNKESGLF